MATASSKVRLAPRFSLNALAEYLVAGAARRQSIIQEQRNPKTYQVAYYREAEDAIRECLLSGALDLGPLEAARGRLKPELEPGEWEASRTSDCAEAIAAFAAMASSLPLAGLTTRRGPNKTTSLLLAGVAVSVRPEVLLATADREPRHIGAIKLYFSKKGPMREEQALYTGTLVHLFLEDVYSRSGTADQKLVFVIDVFGGKHFTAPRSFKRRRSDTLAACGEIARSWAPSAGA